MVITCPINSAAAHTPVAGRVFHSSALTASAARSIPNCAFPNFSIIGFSVVVTKSCVSATTPSACLAGTETFVLLFFFSAPSAYSAFKSPVYRAPHPTSGAPRPTLNRTPTRRLKRLRQLQHPPLPKRRPKDLQPHRQPPLDLPARHGNSRHPRQRPRNRIYISKIHLQRVRRPLSQLERRHRRRRRHNRIHLQISIPEVLRNQRSNLLPLQIVRIVIARRKHIRPQHDPPLDLRPKPRAPRILVHRQQGIRLRPQPESYAVISRQVRASLRRGYNVIGRNRIVRMRHANIDQLAPQFAKDPHTRLDLRPYSGVHPRPKILPGYPDLQAFHGLTDLLRISWHRGSRGRRIPRIPPRNRLQNHRHILYVIRKRPNPVQRRCKRNQPVARHPPITPHHRRHPAKRPRLPYRSSRIRPQRRHRQPRRHRRSRSSARSARHAIQRHRILHRPVRRILVRTSHRELVAIGLAHNHRPSRVEPLHGRSIKWRHIILQYLRPASSRRPPRTQHILNRHRHTRQWRQRLPIRNRRINFIRLRIRAFRRKRQKRIQLPIPLFNPRKEIASQFPRGNLPRSQRLPHPINRPISHKLFVANFVAQPILAVRPTHQFPRRLYLCLCVLCALCVKIPT